MTRTLVELGWDEGWQEAFEQHKASGVPGRVVSDGRVLRLEAESGSVNARLTPGHRSLHPGDGTRPVCGDWVVVKQHTGCQQATVVATLPRRTRLARQALGGVDREQVIVANMTSVWIVCGLDRSQSLRSLFRYQALARSDRITCRVLLNKADVCPNPEEQVALARQAAPGLDVLLLSASRAQGLEPLMQLVSERETIALVGPSGVGKSTVVNQLCHRADQRTSEVRVKDRRGRHTTSTRCLVRSRASALLVDTPGLREIGLLQAEEGISRVFSDIVELAATCRFRDCRHDQEPGCAVKLGLQRGTICQDRFLRYLELVGEARSRAPHSGRRRHAD